MQLSALLALLPLAAAAALPQSRGSVEARDVDCDSQFDQCCGIPASYQGEIRSLLEAVCPSRCFEALEQCNAGQAEKRSVEEAPLEARDSEDECDQQFDQCCGLSSFLSTETRNMVAAHCPSRCFEALDQCTANQTKKRSVEETPLEVRDSEDECDQQFDQCCGISSFLSTETRNMVAAHCPSRCFGALDQCNAKQAEKRSVEARDNGSEATTACYGKLAACKHKGTPVAECYGNLSRCVQDVYQKFFG
ncbi:hypothetical protein Trihar35433_7562 [Trichoderma harzianum]|nr:hypothetical protein Trihar35433_7562 [Trichoderma harzianum]